MCSTGYYWCAQWEIIMCSTGHYWCAQWDIMHSTEHCWWAPWEFILHSTGHYRGAQQEVMCSTGVLNRKLLCAQQDIIGELNRKLLCVQLDIIGVLNGKLGAQWETMCSTGHYWCAQWESIFGAPWEINGVHIVVVVNNIRQTSSDLHALQEYSHTWIWCVVSAWKVGLNWGLCRPLDTCNLMGLGVFCHTMKTCNGSWDWKLKLSTVKWSFLSYYEII